MYLTVIWLLKWFRYALVDETFSYSFNSPSSLKKRNRAFSNLQSNIGKKAFSYLGLTLFLYLHSNLNVFFFHVSPSDYGKLLIW